jgi:hypothetical protein
VQIALWILMAVACFGCVPGFIGGGLLSESKQTAFPRPAKGPSQTSNQPLHPEAKTGIKLLGYYKDMFQVRDSVRVLLETPVGRKRIRLLLEMWWINPDSTAWKEVGQAGGLPRLLNHLQPDMIGRNIALYREAIEAYQAAVGKARAAFVSCSNQFMYLKEGTTFAGADQELSMHLQTLTLFAVRYQDFSDWLDQVYQNMADLHRLSDLGIEEGTEANAPPVVEPFSTLNWSEFLQQSLEDLSRIPDGLPITEGDEITSWPK